MEVVRLRQTRRNDQLAARVTLEHQARIDLPEESKSATISQIARGQDPRPKIEREPTIGTNQRFEPIVDGGQVRVEIATGHQTRRNSAGTAEADHQLAAE